MVKYEPLKNKIMLSDKDKNILLKVEDFASAVAGFEHDVNELSCQVDAFVVKNSVKLLIKKWFSDVLL